MAATSEPSATGRRKATDPRITRRNSGTGGSGAGPTGSQVGAAAAAETPVASGSAGPEAAQPGVPETGPSNCWKCGKEGHYRSNCPERKKDKRKHSGGTGLTPGGKQAKTGSSVEATKHRKPVFNWSQVTLVVLEKDGQPLSLDKYKEVKNAFVLKEIDLALKEGTMIEIDQWCFFQNRVEVKFANVASTEIFRKILVDCKVLSREKWEEEHVKLHHFTGKIDESTMNVPFDVLRDAVDARRKVMGIPGRFRLEKVVCQTPTGAIILVSCDDEARQKWEEASSKKNPFIRIPGSGLVEFQERYKGKKTLQEVSTSLEGLSMAVSPGAQAAPAEGTDKK